MIVGGNIRGATRTLTTAVALYTAQGDFGLALALGVVLLLLALLVNVALQVLQGRGGSRGWAARGAAPLRGTRGARSRALHRNAGRRGGDRRPERLGQEHTAAPARAARAAQRGRGPAGRPRGVERQTPRPAGARAAPARHPRRAATDPAARNGAGKSGVRVDAEGDETPRGEQDRGNSRRAARHHAAPRAAPSRTVGRRGATRGRGARAGAKARGGGEGLDCRRDRPARPRHPRRPADRHLREPGAASFLRPQRIHRQGDAARAPAPGGGARHRRRGRRAGGRGDGGSRARPGPRSREPRGVRLQGQRGARVLAMPIGYVSRIVAFTATGGPHLYWEYSGAA